MNRESLGPEKKKIKEGDGGECGGFKCEVMEREAVTGGVHAVSVLACGSAWSRVFIHLSKNMEGRGWGSVKKGHTRGVCHIVWRWHLRRPTGLHSGQPVSPSVLPLREWGVSMASHSHTSVSACLAADLYSTVLSLTYWALNSLDWHI